MIELSEFKTANQSMAAVIVTALDQNPKMIKLENDGISYAFDDAEKVGNFTLKYKRNKRFVENLSAQAAKEGRDIKL